MRLENHKTLPFNPESCNAILDTAKVIYNEEQSRFNQYETKNSIGLAFTGVIFGAYLRYLSTVTPNFENIPYAVYSSFFNIVILIFFCLGIICFLKSIKSGEYQQVELGNIVEYDFARDDIAKVRLELAATYKVAVDQNKSILENKSKFFDRGLNFASSAFVLFIFFFLIEEVIKNVWRQKKHI